MFIQQRFKFLDRLHPLRLLLCPWTPLRDFRPADHLFSIVIVCSRIFYFRPFVEGKTDGMLPQ